MAMRPPLLRGGISQMTSRAPRSSLKAPPAPKRRVAVPSTVAMTPWPGLRALSIMSWMASAAARPTKAWIWPTTRPCAASAPKTSPATATLMSRRGAIEKIV